jgi:hypothetical protein
MKNSHKNGVPRWRPRLENYRGEEVSKLTFPSEKDMHAAIDLVWVGKLLGMPFRLAPDGDSLVVPKKGVPYFKEAGIRFVQSEFKVN